MYFLSNERDGDVLALRQEIDDLRTSLKEERWYVEELKKEVAKVSDGKASLPLDQHVCIVQ